MAKSLLLRDREGRMCGYLQLNQNVLRCRITVWEVHAKTNAHTEAELIVYKASGDEERFPVEACGCEQCFPASVQSLSGAVIVQRGNLRLFTDEKSAQRYERAQRQKPKETQETKITMPQEEKGMQEEGKAALSAAPPADEPARQEFSWPQRRWPPPVCMPSAVYLQGRWVEQEPAVLPDLGITGSTAASHWMWNSSGHWRKKPGYIFTQKERIC